MNKVSLTTMSRVECKRAGHVSAGHSSVDVYGGREHVLRQTVIALRQGLVLDDRQPLSHATLQVLCGRVRLSVDGQHMDGLAGDLIGIPTAVHSLEAVEDSVLLLTVAGNGG